MTLRGVEARYGDIFFVVVSLGMGYALLQLSGYISNAFPSFDTLACGKTPSDSCITGAIFTVGIFYLIAWLLWLGIAYVLVPLAPLVLVVGIRYGRSWRQ